MRRGYLCIYGSSFLDIYTTALYIIDDFHITDDFRIIDDIPFIVLHERSWYLAFLLAGDRHAPVRCSGCTLVMGHWYPHLVAALVPCLL